MPEVLNHTDLAAAEGAASPDPYGLDVAAAVAAEPWRLTPHAFAARCSAGRWRAWPHLRYVGERIADAVVSGGGRLIINMPPGHGKSSLLSLWTPVWLLDNLPQMRVILGGHGAQYAATWGRLVRNEFAANEFLTTRLADDSTAADRWNTPEGGGMVTTGVGSGLTGWRGNCLLIDDPHPTWEAVHSRVHRDRVTEWFGGTLYDRAEPGATIVLLMHRWHPEDLAGYLIEKHADPWQVIRLPALAEAGDPLGRAEGDALCPQRFDAAALASIQVASDGPVWDAKYQQDPTGVKAGRVYHRFTPADHCDKTLAPRPDLPLQLSFDFNFNPGMHVVAGQYDRAADVFTAFDEIHGPYMQLPAALEACGALIDRVPCKPTPAAPLEIYGDATGTQRRAETTQTAYQQVRNYFDGRRVPYRLKVPAANPPVRTRVDTFNAALKDPAGRVHYKLHPGRCPRLLADLRELKPDEAGLIDKHDETLSHSSDAEGYRIIRLRPIRRLEVTPGAVLSAGGRR
jgi:hypothetical protein